MSHGRRLIVLEDPSMPREVIPEDTLEIGRAPEVGLFLGDPSVSRRHAVIRKRDGDLILEDSGSTFGTFVNERPLPSGDSRVLRDGDVLRFGQVQVVCRFDEEGSRLPQLLADAAFAAQANARVLVLEGENVRRRPLAGSRNLIGSAPHCEVRLQDRNGPLEEALIRAAGGRFHLEPRSAAEPPRLNETQSPLTGPAPLHSNSALLVHRAQLLFLYDFEEGGRQVEDPLLALSRRQLLRQAAQATGISSRTLARLSRDRRILGQNLGEILVERRLITPLFWRVVCARLGSPAIREGPLAAAQAQERAMKRSSIVLSLSLLALGALPGCLGGMATVATLLGRP